MHAASVRAAANPLAPRISRSGRDDRPDPGHETVRWERVDLVRKEATGAVARGKAAAPAADELAPKE